MRELSVGPLLWQELSQEARQGLATKLVGLWGATSDQEAFERLTVDKQQALLLMMKRLISIDLWDIVKSIDNVYGSGGVGIDFTAWPFMEATLSRRKDFTRRFAKRKQVSGGFYEKGRPEAVLHYLFTNGKNGKPRQWHVHFDLYSPLDSFRSWMRHIRHEYVGKKKPDWQMIHQIFK
jgi:hypothetical protein